MNKTEFFEDLKDMLRNEFFSKYSADFDVQKLSLDYGSDMDARIGRFFELIFRMKEKFRLAYASNDEVAMQAALIHIRVYAIGLFTLFNSLADDIDTLLRSEKWPEIPENYILPE